MVNSGSLGFGLLTGLMSSRSWTQGCPVVLWKLSISEISKLGTTILDTLMGFHSFCSLGFIV